ncbi:MAG TPA: hypothetical protein PL169_14180, partial [Leptospiraceae bacterium]|nr:hypothetical protein [Leptospiraceae bacterium]
TGGNILDIPLIPPHVVSFAATPATIFGSGAVTLAWQTQAGTSVAIDNGIVIDQSAVNSGCGEDGQRQIYKTKADCAAEWSDKDCEEIPSTSSHYHTGRYMGPFHSYSYSSGRSTRSVGSSHVTRGGFGRSSSFHSSGG